MKYKFQLTLVATGDNSKWDTRSIDVVEADNLTSLLAQFNIVIASVHRRILNDLKLEMQVIDDDIPF